MRGFGFYRLHGTWTLTKRELKKWFNNPIVLLVTIVQPIVWMVLFGKAMNLGAMLSNLPPDLGQQIMRSTFGTSDYFSYMAIGMISFTIMFTSMFGGMSIVWDRRLGFLDKVLSTPVSRATVVIAKGLNAAVRSLFQAFVILGVAAMLGLSFSSTFSPLNLLPIILAICLLSMGLSTIFVAMAVRATRFETPMALVNLVNLPFMFASNVFVPFSMMPSWLQTIARVNPISYFTDAIRQLTVFEMDVSTLVLDFVFLGAFTLVIFALGAFLAVRYLSR